MRNRTLDTVFLTITILGAIYLGLIGFFGIDIVNMFFGGFPILFSRLMYCIIGVSGIYALTLFGRLDNEVEVHKY